MYDLPVGIYTLKSYTVFSNYLEETTDIRISRQNQTDINLVHTNHN